MSTSEVLLQSIFVQHITDEEVEAMNVNVSVRKRSLPYSLVTLTIKLSSSPLGVNRLRCSSVALLTQRRRRQVMFSFAVVCKTCQIQQVP